MMKQAVEQCGGDDRIAEDLAPFCKATIGGQDHGPALVARVDELEEQVATTLNDRQVPDLINDEERRPAQEPDPFAQLAFAFGPGQNADDVGKACKVDAAAGLHSFDPERGGEMTLPGAGRPQEVNDLITLDEVELGERQDPVSVERRLEGEVEAGQVLTVESFAILSAILTRRFSRKVNSSANRVSITSSALVSPRSS